jgi:hypothetical protein
MQLNHAGAPIHGATRAREVMAALGLGDSPEGLGSAEWLRSVESTAATLATADRQRILRLARPDFQEQARQRIAAYVDYMDLGFRPARHHLLLLDSLEAIERGDIDRLMVLMPPGSAKSTYGNSIFTAWYLGRNPTRSVIGASHTQELIDRFGRRARNYFAMAAHREIFGCGLATDSNAAGRWETDQGGEYYATGVGGNVTGHRADLGLIDDPVKSREDADSERSRERAWEWYLNDFMTRLKPGAAQVF